MAAISLNKDNYNDEVLYSDKPVLIDFWASWCGPCKMLSPTVEELSDEVDDVKICKVNVDEERELSREYGIMSIPTLVFIKEGKVVSSSVGVRPKAEILKMIGKDE